MTKHMTSLAIVAGLVLSAAAEPVVGSLNGQAEADSSSSRSRTTLDSGRPEWPIAREPSGRWGVVGEAVARHSGPAVSIEAVTFTTLDRRGRVLSQETFDSAESLAQILTIAGHDASGRLVWKPAGTALLNDGDVGVAFLAVLTDGREFPNRARVGMRFNRGQERTFSVPLEVFDPGQRMGWPLRLDGEPWIAVNTAGTGHHWVGSAVPTDRALFIGQRFALDLLQVDGEGRTHPPLAIDKESHYAWGEEILSAGRGRVVAVERTRRDFEIGDAIPVTENPAGNHVVIQHEPRLFSVYAHMQRATATVNIGDWVERGDPIGLVGNSGKTTEPHLHIHFTDAWPASRDAVSSLSFSQGVPALFWGARVLRGSDTFRLSGSTPLELDVILSKSHR